MNAVGAVAGVAADQVLGEPPAAWHPVVWFGRVMTALEDRCYRNDRATGVLYTAAGVSLGAGTGWLLARVVGRRPATAIATAIAVSGRMLGDVATGIRDQLRAGRLDEARARLPALVGRDPTGLDEGEVARAVVESVAENTVDAVVAPILWAAIGGAPAVLAHRAVNTLDAMVGHRSERYERFGWASARLDDVLAYVPARVAAAVTVLCRPRRARAIAGTVGRDAKHHPSPNAGVVEAAFAAALGLRLGGTNRYHGRVEERPSLGAGRLPTVDDIEAAVRLLRHVTWVTAGVALAGAAIRRRAFT